MPSSDRAIGRGAAGQGVLPIELKVQLTELPITRLNDWVKWVDQPQTPAEESALRGCVNQGRPYGDKAWVKKVQKQLGWREPLKIGRPRKKK